MERERRSVWELRTDQPEDRRGDGAKLLMRTRQNGWLTRPPWDRSYGTEARLAPCDHPVNRVRMITSLHRDHEVRVVSAKTAAER